MSYRSERDALVERRDALRRDLDEVEQRLARHRHARRQRGATAGRRQRRLLPRLVAALATISLLAMAAAMILAMLVIPPTAQGPSATHAAAAVPPPSTAPSPAPAPSWNPPTASGPLACETLQEGDGVRYVTAEAVADAVRSEAAKQRAVLAIVRQRNAAEAKKVEDVLRRSCESWKQTAPMLWRWGSRSPEYGDGLQPPRDATSGARPA